MLRSQSMSWPWHSGEGRPQGAHLVQQYVDGEITIVLPDDAKEAEFIYPKPEW